MKLLLTASLLTLAWPPGIAFADDAVTVLTIAQDHGCLACHAIGENGSHGGLGPDLPEIRSMVPRLAIKRSVAVGPGIMPAYEDLGEKKLNQVADYLASLD